MKKLKVCLVLAIVAVASFAFRNSIAQTFSSRDDGENEVYITPRQKQIIDLLKQEITSNPVYEKDKEDILEQLDSASQEDAVGAECYKYSPFLVNAVNSKAQFLNFFYIQGNFKYSFKVNSGQQSTTEAFSFYEWYEDGSYVGLLPSVSIQNGNSEQNLDGEKAGKYIEDNYCKPLNQILEQNRNLPIPQLLGIIKQRFSK